MTVITKDTTSDIRLATFFPHVLASFYFVFIPFIQSTDINLKTMSRNLGNNYFSELGNEPEEIEAYCSFAPLQNAHNFEKEHHVDSTGVFNQVELVSRSHKRVGGDFQISFQEGFLDEHLEAFKKETQKYMENVGLHAEQNKSFSRLGAEEEEGHEEVLCPSFQGILIPQNDRNQFEKDLENEKKLKEFLQAISKTASKNVTEELVYISWKVWEHYLTYKKLTSSMMEKISRNFTEKNSKELFNELEYLSLKHRQNKSLNDQKEVLQAFQEFILFWVTTTFFVIEEYFENPYSGLSMKRQRSEVYSDDSFWNDFQNQDSFNMGAPCKRVYHLTDL